LRIRGDNGDLLTLLEMAMVVGVAGQHPTVKTRQRARTTSARARTSTLCGAGEVSAPTLQKWVSCADSAQNGGDGDNTTHSSTMCAASRLWVHFRNISPYCVNTEYRKRVTSQNRYKTQFLEAIAAIEEMPNADINYSLDGSLMTLVRPRGSALF
jgi:hypothetical protein